MSGAPRDRVRGKLEQGAVVIDVRTPGEFASGHYPGALNIPMSDIGSRVEEIGDKAAPVVLYCHSGSRSAMARRILLKAGFTDVTNAGSLGRMPKAGDG